MARPSHTLRDASVGAMILAAVVLLAWMAARVGSVGGYRSGRELTFIFEDATGLVETAPVAAAGVTVGTVVSIDWGEGGAKVVARIRRDLPLFVDARATVRAKSLLGEKFVALDPGQPSSGELQGDRVKTAPGADLDRMMGVMAKAAEAVDPQDLKAIAHGLASSLGGEGSTPQAVKDLAHDLHTLAEAADKLSSQSGSVTERIKPLLAHLDEAVAKANASLEAAQPSLKRLPETLDQFSRLSARLEALLGKADKLDKEDLKRDLRQILEQEGVYVRLSSRKIAGGKEKEEALPKATPSPAPGLER